MNYRECAEWLKNHDNILLLTHVRPDGDTLGSASALCSALRRCGKKAALYNNPDITPKYMKYIEQYVDADFAYDCAVAVDVAEKHMFPVGYNGAHDAYRHHGFGCGFGLGNCLGGGSEAGSDASELLSSDTTLAEDGSRSVGVDTVKVCLAWGDAGPHHVVFTDIFTILLHLGSGADKAHLPG